MVVLPLDPADPPDLRSLRSFRIWGAPPRSWAYTRGMNFETLQNQLYIEDDRTPDQIREAILGHQQRIDLAREAGRLIEVSEDAERRREGTRDQSCLKGYSRTSTGIRRGDVSGLPFTRDFDRNPESHQAEQLAKEFLGDLEPAEEYV